MIAAGALAALSSLVGSREPDIRESTVAAVKLLASGL